jgi:DNA-binding MarR family transcriptional regulator
VTLNIRATRKAPDKPGKTPPASRTPAGAGSTGHRPTGAAGRRDALITELVDEMTSWSPRDRMSAFRSWLKGSLSLIHLHVISTLEADGPLPMSRLADMLDVSVASATGIVTRMEERNLVERQHDQEDRRVVLVIPTETGISVFRIMAEQRRVRLKAMLAKLTDEELASLRTGLRAVDRARAELHAEHDPTTAAPEPPMTGAHCRHSKPAGRP